MITRWTSAILSLVLLTACGEGGSGTDSNGLYSPTSAPAFPTTHIVSDADAAATSQAEYREMAASPEFQAAQERMRTCMAEEGYVGNVAEEGVVLKDGSVLKMGPGEG